MKAFFKPINNGKKLSILPIGIFLFFIVTIMASCKIVQPSFYFRNYKTDTLLKATTLIKQELKIKRGDILSITISSLNPTEDNVFNAPIHSSSATATETSHTGYKVDNTGYILIHKVGKILVEDITRSELKLILEKQLQPFYKEPIVTINFSNHFITILGVVGIARKISLPEDQINIFEALASSNDIVKEAKYSNLLLIREVDAGTKQIKQINLEDYSIFSSPYFNLMPNDILVVKPDEEKMVKQEKLTKVQQLASYSLQAVGLALIVYQAFFRK
jgi:polysaccharide biosynthesis/export protein